MYQAFKLLSKMPLYNMGYLRHEGEQGLRTVWRYWATKRECIRRCFIVCCRQMLLSTDDWREEDQWIEDDMPHFQALAATGVGDFTTLMQELNAKEDTAI